MTVFHKAFVQCINELTCQCSVQCSEEGREREREGGLGEDSYDANIRSELSVRADLCIILRVDA